MAVNPDSIPRYKPPTLRELEEMFGVSRHMCDICRHMVELPWTSNGRTTMREACVASHDVDGGCDAKWCAVPTGDCRLFRLADL